MLLQKIMARRYLVNVVPTLFLKNINNFLVAYSSWFSWVWVHKKLMVFFWESFSVAWELEVVKFDLKHGIYSIFVNLLFHVWNFARAKISHIQMKQLWFFQNFHFLYHNLPHLSSHATEYFPVSINGLKAF